MEPERSFLSTLTNLAPYHLLGFGALLGTELYQTFFMTKVCYRALPMSAFTTLQKKVFPIYFSLQGILVAFTIVTYPPHGIASLSKSIADLSLLSFAGVMSLLNIVRYGPRTTSAMVERIHQETRDGRKYNDEDISEEMRKINRRFSKEHAMAIHVNLLAIMASVGYGVRLASKLSFDG